MLKLLKYEIIESYRQYLLTFVVFLMLCAITPLVPVFISNILSILVAIAFTGIFIAIFLNVIISFNRSMYKRPGYLTLTLPVRTENLIGAKLIGSLIWVVISTLVLLIGIVGIVLSLILGGILSIVLTAVLGFAPIRMMWYFFAEALLISIDISVIAGVYPASKAAKLDPVESLRHE